jgi:hypothetical protein
LIGISGKDHQVDEGPYRTVEPEEEVPPRTNVSGVYYCSVFKTSWTTSEENYQSLKDTGCFIMTDNARPHVVSTVIKFLTSKGI